MSIWTAISAKYVSPPALPVLAVGNLKGGVGKTSVVAYLAYALAHLGYRVLVIDLDFQASLSTAMTEGIVFSELDGAINLLLGNSDQVFTDTRVVSRGYGHWENLTLVRTSFDLAEVEDRLFAGFVLNKSEDARFLLAQKLSSPSLRNDFDVVLIDTPPRLTIASINAICASTHVIIPTSPTFMAISGAVNFITILNTLKDKLPLHYSVLAVLPTLATRDTFSQQESKRLEELERDIKPIEIWRDWHICRKPDIAGNKGFNNASIREPFLKLGDEVARKMGLRKNGTNSGFRADRDSGVGRYGLSQSRRD